MLAAFASTALLSGTALLAGATCPPPPTVPLPASEPALRAGPTELVAGIYVQGGAYFAGCKQQPRGPYGGTLTARSARTGPIVATRDARAAGASVQAAAGARALHGDRHREPAACAPCRRR